jgi:hypothetical protein
MNANKKSKGEPVADRARAVVRKKRGVWVYQGEMPGAPIVELIDREREKRVQELIGGALRHPVPE